MSSAGLPGLNNFVGEILILAGAFREWPTAAAAGFAGIVFTLVYVLRLVQDTLYGEPRREFELWDLTARELLILVPLAVLVLLIGVHPGPLLDLLKGPVRDLLGATANVMTARSW